MLACLHPRGATVDPWLLSPLALLQVEKLCELEEANISSVRWVKQGNQLAVGDQDGSVYIYDAVKLKRTAELKGHADRVAAIACTNHLVATGG